MDTPFQKRLHWNIFFCFFFRVTYVINENAILQKSYEKALDDAQKEDAEGESLNKCSEFYLFFVL